MHTVLLDRCTGCELCLPPCPVDCIEMRPGAVPAAQRAAAQSRALRCAHARGSQQPRCERQRELDAKKAARAARRAGRHAMNDAEAPRDIRAAARGQSRRRAPNLIYRSPFELLVAVILSAQATDKSVNKATAELFRTARTRPLRMLALGVDGLSNYIKSIGLYNGKAKNIIATCRLAAGAARRRGARRRARRSRRCPASDAKPPTSS